MQDKVNQNSKVIRWIISAILVSFVILFGSTIGEFLASLHNRYSVYPTGTDTNMYGNSFIIMFILIVMTGIMVLFLNGARAKKILLLSILGIFVLAIPITLTADVFPSMIPDSWCRHELKIYSCDDIEWRNNQLKMHLK